MSNDPAYDPNRGVWQPYRDGHPGWAEERAGEIQWQLHGIIDRLGYGEDGPPVAALPPQATVYTVPALLKVGSPVLLDAPTWDLIKGLLGEYKAVVDQAGGTGGRDERGIFLPSGEFDHRAGTISFMFGLDGHFDPGQPLCRHCAHCLDAKTSGFFHDPGQGDETAQTCVGCGSLIRCVPDEAARPLRDEWATDDSSADRRFATDDDLDDFPF